jgi:hypothetical protein
LWTPQVCGYTAALGSQARFAQSERSVLEIGAIAQLGERFNGIEEVVGSIPSGSTTRLFDTARFSVYLDIHDISGACARRVQNKS